MTTTARRGASLALSLSPCPQVSCATGYAENATAPALEPELRAEDTARRIRDLARRLQVDSLDTVVVPRPSNLRQFVRNERAAIALGKALFWDMQVGS